MELDPSLEKDNLYTIASEVELTDELLSALEAHPASWSDLRAWVEYVRATGERPPVPLPSAGEEPEPEPDPVRRSRKPLIAVAALAVSVAVLGGGAWMVGGSNDADADIHSVPLPEPTVTVTETPASELEPEVLEASGDGFYCTARATTVSCVGSNARGALGGGGQTNAHTFTVEGEVNQLVAGGAHACAVTEEHVYCWGDNRWSQVADTAEESLPPTIIAGLEGDVLSIAAGEIHTCAIIAADTDGSGDTAREDGAAVTGGSAVTGEVVCWGSDYSGQLGSGAQGPEASGLTVVEVPPASEVFSTRFGTCALTDGRTFCWGANTNQRIRPGGPEIVGPTVVKRGV